MTSVAHAVNRSLRRPPSAILELPLEGEPRLWLRSDTHEDQERLRLWLVSALPRAVADLQAFAGLPIATGMSA